MRTKTIATVAIAVVVTLAASSWAATIDGTVKMGGIIMSQEGDRSAVQETYNVYDGFSLTQVRLNGTFDSRNHFMLDLREVNLDSRQGDLVYRMPGLFKLTAGYDQHRQVFDPERGVNAERKDWKVGARVTPVDWLALSGAFNSLTREGDRLAHPTGTESVLGARYDNRLTSGEVTAAVHKDRRGGALTYRLSDYADDLDAQADRRGQVVSARLYAPSFFYDKWTHLLRGAYGVRELSNSDIDYKLANVQYTGTILPVDAFQFRYAFEANRIDHEATKLKTDRITNDVDATYFYGYGRLSAGYGYETNDDDRTLTSYQNWRVGGTYRYETYLTAKADVAGRIKKDQEDLTLLRDVDASRIRAKVEVAPADRVSFGGGFTRREREMPDIGVRALGDVVNLFGRYRQEGWGNLSADYNLSTDGYEDRIGAFNTKSHVVTGRMEIDRIPKAKLAGGVTYMDIGRDLDIEKSLVFVEGRVQLVEGYYLEAKYNVYNYDDYILLSRYYTANVVRINVGYDFDLK